jgi:hypothetical protein
VLSEAELDPIFDGAAQEWFRWEGLRTYATEAEEPRLRAYLTGEPYDPASEPVVWLAEIRRRVSQGLRFRKVRVVRSPLGEYERWECEWSFPATERAGQRTFVLDLAEAPDLGRLPDYDWWMFDESVVLVMRYDPSGRFVGAERLDDEQVAAHVGYRDRALEAAVPYERYWAAHPGYWRQP